MKLKQLYRKILMLFLLIFSEIVTVKAQPDVPTENPDNTVPITGLEYLIAAGAAFGAKKIFDKRKSNSK